MSSEIQPTWWKEAVVYQIYPRSFKDTSSDGVGDLKGIISKLDYIKSLGIDVVWLNPVYSSPNDDMGYDISDYRNIMPEFGNMEDFDCLLAGLHERGLKLIMDLVVNHTSDEHDWFQESRKSRDNPYRDFYHWWPAEQGTPPKRHSFFDKNGDAWCYDEQTNAYYLHYFSAKQPDLNWENPQVREEIYEMMKFWFDKGIDGFRMDVITYISKDPAFPDPPENCQGSMWEDFYGSGPRLHEYLREMNDKVLSHYDVMTVAEGPGTSVDNILDLVAPERQELNMSYHFDHINVGLKPRKVVTDKVRDLLQFKEIHSKWDKALANKAWGTIYLGNHDQPRMVSRWGNDSEQWRERSSKLLTTFIMSMRGTPYYYMGDELGMSNIKFDSIDDYRDIEMINWYNLTKHEGGDLQELIESHKIMARDNGRTPIQWDSSKHGGFTKGEPWIRVNDNYKKVNVAEQETNPDSCLSYFRRLVQFRKRNPVLIYGEYEEQFIAHEKIYSYIRTLGDVRMLVLLNFSDEAVALTFPENTRVDEILVNNDIVDPFLLEQAVFRPWQAVICSLV